ncbi:hypothetical protein DY023_05110 [Microbacterium bovistercoris]|uniref:Uncharacterized protein n=1 Tax=Microbacterium bovistercoris TaxID=2293570 RepID=A0A371NVS5_9MICO|nr:hypothetical protein [Microbacterium bovistercoris]REJ06736.1 hypothetical protein DY023_05110 [Microbacterium bovistercoris]
MRYLVLSADYMDPNLRDDESGSEFDVDVVNEVSPSLAADIVEWNNSYQAVIPMDLAARVAAADLIGQLDGRGLDLAGRIEEELRPARVHYYSEGLLKSLP